MLLLRTEKLPEGPDRLYELEKFDGYRALAIKSGGTRYGCILSERQRLECPVCDSLLGHFQRFCRIEVFSFLPRGLQPTTQRAPGQRKDRELHEPRPTGAARSPPSVPGTKF